jgi:3-isopropylmalate/(R)-2-methylmalate dehydratase small subunit
VTVTLDYRITIDLPEQIVTTPFGEKFSFAISAFRKHCLVNGHDEIDLSLQHADEIRVYEARRRREAPWLFSN